MSLFINCGIDTNTNTNVNVITSLQEESVWITDWIEPESELFKYRISKTKRQINKEYKYRYDIYFYSKDSILLKNVIVSVNNVPIVNIIENNIYYDFKFGENNNDIGDLKVSFLYGITGQSVIKIEWDSIIFLDLK